MSFFILYKFGFVSNFHRGSRFQDIMQFCLEKNEKKNKKIQPSMKNCISKVYFDFIVFAAMKPKRPNFHKSSRFRDIMQFCLEKNEKNKKDQPFPRYDAILSRKK